MNATKVLISAAILAVGFAFSGGAIAADTPTKAPSAKQTAQRAKMKSCNVDAKSQALKGKARKNFMKTCMSKKAV